MKVMISVKGHTAGAGRWITGLARGSISRINLRPIRYAMSSTDRCSFFAPRHRRMSYSDDVSFVQPTYDVDDASISERSDGQEGEDGEDGGGYIALNQYLAVLRKKELMPQVISLHEAIEAYHEYAVVHEGASTTEKTLNVNEFQVPPNAAKSNTRKRIPVTKRTEIVLSCI